MARPYRKYTDKKTGRQYHLIIKDGKKRRRYIKNTVGATQKQTQSVNIHFHEDSGRRIKPKKKAPKLNYTKKINPEMKPANTAGLPLFQFAPTHFIPHIGHAGFKEATTEPESKGKNIDLMRHAVMTPAEQEEFDKWVRGEEVRGKKLQKWRQNNTGKNPNPSINSTYFDYRAKGGDESFDLYKKYLKTNYPDYHEPTGAEFYKAHQEYQLVHEPEEYAKTLLRKKKPISGITSFFSGKKPEAEEKEEVHLESTTATRKQGAHGTQGGGIEDGLFNDEIEKIAKKRIKGYVVPVIAQDEISQLPKYVRQGQKIFGGVINTNPSTSDGSGEDGHRVGHWTSFVVDARDDFPTIEWFDPLVENKPSKELISTLKDIGRAMNPEKMFLFKNNQVQRQKYNSNGCGIHSLKFLEDRFRGIGWSEATGYNHYMKKKIGDDSADGERKIQEVAKTYKKYL